MPIAGPDPFVIVVESRVHAHAVAGRWRRGVCVWCAEVACVSLSAGKWVYRSCCAAHCSNDMCTLQCAVWYGIHTRDWCVSPEA